MKRENDSVEHGTAWERRRRSDWAGIRVDDAFRPNVAYVVRTTARRELFRQIREAQRGVAEAFGLNSGREYKPKTKPQIAPCYSSFPRAAAAAAAVGMSAFVEYQSISDLGVMAHRFAAERAREAKSECNDDSIEEEESRMLSRIADSVEVRLLTASLSRMPGLSSLEFYRLFLASQLDLRFTDLPELVNAAVMFGDVLPPLGALKLHRTTSGLLDALLNASLPYYADMCNYDESTAIECGMMWTRALHRIIVKHLRAEADFRKQSPPVTEIAVSPLNRPAPPALGYNPEEDHELKFALSIPEEEKKGDRNERENMQTPRMKTMKALGMLFGILRRAGGLKENWEDPRAETVERILRADPYKTGPIEGEPALGLECVVNLGGGELHSGELFERVMEAEADDDEVRKLYEESAPLASIIRGLLYPNIRTTTSMERYRATGSLDPSRLAAAAFSDAVYRRILTGRKTDESGKPVLVIAADASGSLNPRQAELIRLLCAGWIRSVRRSSVQLICCLYHSDHIRMEESGRLVQWITHPRKTVGRDTAEAMRALAGFRSGQGAQADALSIRFIVDEAQRIAAGRMVFLVLLTDADWNKSFHGKANGAQEVAMTFEGLDADYPERLHKTVVVLGKEHHNLGNTPDAVINVPDEELKDIDAVSRRIARYVAVTMKERKRLMRA